LKDTSKVGPVDYSLIAKSEKERQQPLDPNHSHFILVDNSRISFGGEIDFRAALESAISKRKTSSSNIITDDIPIVVLVLEGGVGTLKTVLESVKNDSPCVFVEVNLKQ
jgi:transient receptor potential cation channel subfamily M protein 2